MANIKSGISAIWGKIKWIKHQAFREQSNFKKIDFMHDLKKLGLSAKINVKSEIDWKEKKWFKNENAQPNAKKKRKKDWMKCTIKI